MKRLLSNTLAVMTCVCACTAAAQTASTGSGQAFPSKAVRLLVGSAPGGGADFIARALSSKLAESFGQSVVVENRPGANSAIASEVLVRSPPDGHTLMINVIGHTINPWVMKLNFDP